jgi:hypothetical protein
LAWVVVPTPNADTPTDCPVLVAAVVAGVPVAALVDELVVVVVGPLAAVLVGALVGLVAVPGSTSGGVGGEMSKAS